MPTYGDDPIVWWDWDRHAVSNDFDEGHGHKYGTQPLTAWYAVVRPPGWAPVRLGDLRERLRGISR